MRTLNITILAIALVLLTGCASTGHTDLNQHLDSFYGKGMEEVVDEFGYPNNVIPHVDQDDNLLGASSIHTLREAVFFYDAYGYVDEIRLIGDGCRGETYKLEDE
jgi:hypothetical protein